ncbi:hypothetical protein HYPSUDRAFT_416259, partial [Hypholoma sublateritium FD-334 SS-4]
SRILCTVLPGRVLSAAACSDALLTYTIPPCQRSRRRWYHTLFPRNLTPPHTPDRSRALLSIGAPAMISDPAHEAG